MILSNYHTHSTFCDGKDTPEEIVTQAIKLGMTSIGFSSHSYTSFDTDSCMSVEGTEKYKTEINRLKVKYKDKINILLGIEQDYDSDFPAEDFDYVIGSVHNLFVGDRYYPLDCSAEILHNLIDEHFDGDAYSMAEYYYEKVSEIYEKTHCDIIGHFDLITKYNENGEFFDENNPRYIEAVDSALNKLFKTPAVFEINTGAIARGYRKTPYPSAFICEKIISHGKDLIISSDCHDKDFLLASFDRFSYLATTDKLLFTQNK